MLFVFLFCSVFVSVCFYVLLFWVLGFVNVFLFSMCFCFLETHYVFCCCLFSVLVCLFYTLFLLSVCIFICFVLLMVSVVCYYFLCLHCYLFCWICLLLF